MLAGPDEVLCDGNGLLRDAGRHVVRERYPPQFKDFVGLEQSALTLCSYATLVVNGLFQTESYARALIGGGFLPLPQEEVQELVEARIERRTLFDRRPTALIELVLGESALRQMVGSREVMRDQLAHLVEHGRRRNVTFQAMPFDRGLRGDHAGLDGPMTPVETREHKHMVYPESRRESLLISEPAEVSVLLQRYATIRAQALGPDESLALIERWAGEL